MRKQIFGSILFTSIISILLVSALMFADMYERFYEEMKQAVKKECALIETGYTLSGKDYLYALRDKYPRITLIAPDGTVLYDNAANTSSMENHAGRPEVKSAFETGAGEATRISSTIGEQTFYHAVRLPDGNILRVAGTTDSIYASLLACLPFTLLAVALIAALSAFIARRRTQRITKPINTLDLEKPLSNEVYEELSPLLTRIEKQRRQITAHMEELKTRQDELSAITANMSEGLILLNKSGTVLSVNKSAARLYGINSDYVGRDMLTIDRSQTVRELLKGASFGKHAETTKEISGRKYQLIANPVLKSGEINGIVLLMFDITERSQAEQMRREFTANVSHELKTPLQSIMGSAELLKNRMVKPADIPGFVDRIYSEACRLVALIDDIIRLSRLDEQDGELPLEDVDLIALAQDVAEQLNEQARERSVTVEVHGADVVYRGVRQLLWEIIYNLCDNAVKYNRRGGRVDITVSAGPEGAAVTVADTGIGIPKEDQGRIFERFYRVDKSHSKEVAGTGLGLSIVKHAAQYLGATIALESAEGRGTTISVKFPS